LRTFTNAPAPSASPGGNLANDLVRRATDHPKSVCLSRLTEDGWHDLSAAQVRAEVVALARGLLAAGIAAGDRVLLCSSTRYEWTLVDYACWEIGAVVVPVYATSPPAQLHSVLLDSGAVAAVVETDELRTAVTRHAPAAVALLGVWTIETGGLDDLASLGVDIDDARLDKRRSYVRSEDPATLIYTSSTTANPLGCVLTHGNFSAALDAVTSCMPELFEADDAATLVVLPMPHVLARLVQVGCVRAGIRLGHSSRTVHLADDLQSFQPSFVLGLPRIFESLVSVAGQRAHARGRGALFTRAADTAIAYSRARSAGRVSPLLRARHAAWERRVYRQLRRRIGSRTRWLITGGAPLAERSAHLLAGIGLPVLEGYGSSESTGALCVNTPDDIRIGTVGQPLPGTTVRVSDEGELLFRGPQVFSGYWRGENHPLDAPVDGWLHTGDLGEIDAEGFVRVTGRTQEILVTAGGKRVAPSILEEHLTAHPLVDHAMIVGDGRPYLAALITLDPLAARQWATTRGSGTSPRSLAADPALLVEIRSAVDAANEQVSPAEAIRHFRVLPTAWTEDSGHLTPTAKVRRHAVMRDFSGDVEALYN
jgi:long-chain acyl-CoA synthetase